MATFVSVLIQTMFNPIYPVKSFEITIIFAFDLDLVQVVEIYLMIYFYSFPFYSCLFCSFIASQVVYEPLSGLLAGCLFKIIGAASKINKTACAESETKSEMLEKFSQSCSTSGKRNQSMFWVSNPYSECC